CRDGVLFDQHLDGIGQRLQEAFRAHAIGPHAALHAAELFAEEVDVDVGGQAHANQDDDHLSQDYERVVPLHQAVTGSLLKPGKPSLFSSRGSTRTGTAPVEAPKSRSMASPSLTTNEGCT